MGIFLFVRIDLTREHESVYFFLTRIHDFTFQEQRFICGSQWRKLWIQISPSGRYHTEEVQQNS